MPDAPKPRRPVGKPLPLTEAALDAETSPEAMQAAAESAYEWAARAGGPLIRSLLEAEPEPEPGDNG
jgi:hypothetical protein